MINLNDFKQYLTNHNTGFYNLVTLPGKTISIQVYGSYVAQANIQINNNAVIKFEERSPGLFTVAMCANNDPNYTIQYHNSITVSYSDNIATLLEKFPNSNYVADVVGSLLLN